jgi:hypothetical protein
MQDGPNDTEAASAELPSFRGFARERQTFAAHKAELLRDHEGKYVVIRGDAIVGIRATYEEALEVGYDRFGLEPFFVKELLSEDPVILITRFVLPCPT